MWSIFFYKLFQDTYFISIYQKRLFIFLIFIINLLIKKADIPLFLFSLLACFYFNDVSEPSHIVFKKKKFNRVVYENEKLLHNNILFFQKCQAKCLK